MPDGPYSHRYSIADDLTPRCRVCGSVPSVTDPHPGCPAGVDVGALKTGRPLSTAGDVVEAREALRVIWAAEKARQEEGSE